MIARRAAWLAGALVLVGSLACNALVGGDCKPGLVPEAGACRPADGAGADGAGANGVGGATPSSQSASNGASGGAGGTGTSSGQPSASGSGGGNCLPPLTACPDGCVDLKTNPDNCGKCDLECPTEICIAGKCTGGPIGHVIIIGMSYALFNAPGQQLLGNGVFLPSTEPLTILDFRKHTKPANAKNTDDLLAAEAKNRARSFVTKTVTSAAELSTELDSGKHALLFIHDQPSAASGELAALGASIAPAVGKFAKKGGTIVVLATQDGVGEMKFLLTGSGILNTVALADGTGKSATNQVPTDGLGIGVQSPFLAKSVSSTIATLEASGPSVSYVITDTLTMAPIAIHKTVSE
jgi:hypothetical protein